MDIVFNVDKNTVFLIFGQDGVADSIGACGAPGPGSKDFGRPVQEDAGRRSEIPGPDPRKDLR